MVHHADDEYYELLVDGQQAGLLVYHMIGSHLSITHTVIEQTYRGRGLSWALVGRALDDIRTRSVTVSNYCAVVSRFVEKHPDVPQISSTRRRPDPRPRLTRASAARPLASAGAAGSTSRWPTCVRSDRVHRQVEGDMHRSGIAGRLGRTYPPWSAAMMPVASVCGSASSASVPLAFIRSSAPASSEIQDVRCASRSTRAASSWSESSVDSEPSSQPSAPRRAVTRWRMARHHRSRPLNESTLRSTAPHVRVPGRPAVR